MTRTAVSVRLIAGVPVALVDHTRAERPGLDQVERDVFGDALSCMAAFPGGAGAACPANIGPMKCPLRGLGGASGRTALSRRHGRGRLDRCQIPYAPEQRDVSVYRACASEAAPAKLTAE